MGPDRSQFTREAADQESVTNQINQDLQFVTSYEPLFEIRDQGFVLTLTSTSDLESGPFEFAGPWVASSCFFPGPFLPLARSTKLSLPAVRSWPRWDGVCRTRSNVHPGPKSPSRQESFFDFIWISYFYQPDLLCRTTTGICSRF